MKIHPSFFLLTSFVILICSALGETSDATGLCSPLMMFSDHEVVKNKNEVGFNPEECIKDPRSLKGSENAGGSSLQQRGDLENGDVQEMENFQKQEQSERSLLDENPTMVDRFMAVIGNPVGAFFGPNKKLESEERARFLKEKQLTSLKVAFDSKLRTLNKNQSDLSATQTADLLIQLKNEFNKSEINKSDLIDRLLELAEQDSKEDTYDEFVFSIFDESLLDLQKAHTTPEITTSVFGSTKQSPEELAQQLIQAAKNSPLFSKILRTKRVQWCLGWAISRDYSQDVLNAIKTLANEDRVSFASPEEEKDQYQILYNNKGALALENEFMKLLQKQSYQSSDVTLGNPREIAELLMSLRLKFHQGIQVRDGKIDLQLLDDKIDLQLFSLAKEQGLAVQNAFYYKMFDQSLEQLQNTQQERLAGHLRELSASELAQQYIEVVRQSSLVTTIPTEKLLLYCKSWARYRLANEEILDCIENQYK